MLSDVLIDCISGEAAIEASITARCSMVTESCRGAQDVSKLQLCYY